MFLLRPCNNIAPSSSPMLLSRRLREISDSFVARACPIMDAPSEDILLPERSRFDSMLESAGATSVSQIVLTPVEVILLWLRSR